jgi:colanic acid/amylovoran biosynthesis glycosyltransferase
MRIAYFVNQYPKVSHTFIRREILALEARGLTIQRFALRGWDAELVDPDDTREVARTRFVLRHGLAGLAGACLRLSCTSPLRVWAGVRAAFGVACGGDRTWLHHLVSLAEGIQLAEWLRAARVTHLHAHFGTNSAEVAMLASVVSGLPYSFTVHGSDEWDRPRQYKLREKVARASFAVCISQYTRAQLARWAQPEHRHRLHVVHCGLDSDFLEAPRLPVPDNWRLVCVGRLCREKAQEVLLEAIALLRERGMRVELVLAGDGESRAKLEDRIRDLALIDQVRITGWVGADEVRRLLQQSRGLVLPSLMEALPVVLMEAMAIGRPVVSTYVGGIPELVRPGIDGWLVPASGVAELAEAIESLLRTPVDRLEQKTSMARQRVRARHDIHVEAAKLETLFRAAAAGLPVCAADWAGVTSEARCGAPVVEVTLPTHAGNRQHGAQPVDADPSASFVTRSDRFAVSPQTS